MQTQLGKWIARAVVAALSLVDSFFISKIKNLTVQRGLRLSLEPAKQTALALADDNPRNDEQVEEIWQTFANQQLPSYAETEIGEALENVEDDDIRIVLQTISAPAVNLIRVVTDSDPNNRDQIRLMFNEFVKSPATQQVALDHIVIPFLVEKIKDDALREFILELLKNLSEGGDGTNVA